MPNLMGQKIIALVINFMTKMIIRIAADVVNFFTRNRSITFTLSLGIS